MRITIIHELDENGVDPVFTPMLSFNEAKKVVDALNKKAQELAKAEYGADWEDYSRHYYAKEYSVLSGEQIIKSLM